MSIVTVHTHYTQRIYLLEMCDSSKKLGSYSYNQGQITIFEFFQMEKAEAKYFPQ